MNEYYSLMHKKYLRCGTLNKFCSKSQLLCAISNKKILSSKSQYVIYKNLSSFIKKAFVFSPNIFIIFYICVFYSFRNRSVLIYANVLCVSSNVVLVILKKKIFLYVRWNEILNQLLWVFFNDSPQKNLVHGNVFWRL